MEVHILWCCRDFFPSSLIKYPTMGVKKSDEEEIELRLKSWLFVHQIVMTQHYKTCHDTCTGSENINFTRTFHLNDQIQSTSQLQWDFEPQGGIFLSSAAQIKGFHSGATYHHSLQDGRWCFHIPHPAGKGACSQRGVTHDTFFLLKV